MKNKTKYLLFVLSLFVVVMLCMGFHHQSYATPNHNITVTTPEELKAALADDTYEIIALGADITLNAENTSSGYYEINVDEEQHRKLDLDGHTLKQEQDVKGRLYYKNDHRIFELQDNSEGKTGKVISYGNFIGYYNEEHTDNAFIFNHIVYENNGNGSAVVYKNSSSSNIIHFTVDGVTFYYPNNAPLSDSTELELLDFVKVLPKNQNDAIGFYNDSNENHLSDLLSGSHELYLNGELWTGDRTTKWARDVYFVESDTNGSIEIKEKAYTVNFDTSGVPDLVISPEKVKEGGLIMPPDVWTPQYECVGWYKEPEFVNIWEFESDTVQDNITIYGKFVLREAYDVWVGGHRFTKDHLNVNLGEGTATFDPERSLLTLNNVSIADTYEWKTWYEACIYSELPELYIILVGNNTIAPNSHYGDAIDVPAGGHNVIINGSGTLNITGGYYGTYLGEGGEPGGNLIIQNGAIVNVTNTDAAGLWVNNNVDIINSTVTIFKDNNNYSGIVSNEYGTITVDNSTVTITTKAQAIHFGTYELTDHRFHLISGSVTLTSTADGADVIHVQPEAEGFPPVETGRIMLDISLDSGRLELNVPKGGGMGTNAPADQIHILGGFEYKKGTSLRDTSTAEEGTQIIIEKEQALPTTITVTFKDGEETIDTQIIAYGGNATVPPAPTKAGNDFIGWYADPGLLTPFEFNAGLTKDTTIYAKFDSENIFPDVPAGKWYSMGIRYCKNHGIMGGYETGLFGLNDNISRGQIATMLYRLAGSPDTTGLANPFTDVPEGRYYTNAIKWAFSKGITTGKTATSFDPLGNVTRQELAVFMARYAKEILGIDIKSNYDITGIADYSNLSTWAIAPMQYIMEKGVITGDMKLGYARILPKNNATRAEAATMFMRFCENIISLAVG